MPNNKKSAGGRPAKNFEPRKTAGKHLGARAASDARNAKAGSRSPGHRGYRPESEEAPAKKARWSSEERAAKGRTPDRRDGSRREDDRQPREHGRRDHVAGGVYARDAHDHSGRGGRQHAGGARKPFGRDAERRDERPRFDRDDRAPRRDDRGDRPRFERAERPRFDRDDRAPRRDDRGDRPRFDRDDRAPRRDDRGDRPRFDRAERPRFDREERRAPRDSGSKFYPDKSERSFTPQDDVVLERLQAEAIEATDVAGVTFGDLGLGTNIVRALGDLGADAPFPIQAATIPVVLSGRDVLGRGRTGSGKTIAFGAPTVERLMENKGGTKRAMGRAPRALILAPTRELALQIDRTVQPLAQSVGLFTTQIYGGVPQGRQVGALQRGVDIVIGTPGRIEDLIDQRKLDLSQVKVVVLDEADHMCDLGFLEPVQRILRLTAPDSQKLLFSATLDSGVAALVDEFLVDPAVHEVAGEDQASGTIDHRVLVVDHRDKRDIVLQLADRPGKTLIFSRTRAFAEDLTDYLEDNGLRAVALHGDLNQNRRTRNLAQLTSGRVDVLVATDVAARGIHVDDIDLVIQADAPDEYKTYLHRSGRTGRAGQLGTVVTLIPRQRQRRMAELLNRAEIDVDFADARLGDDILAEIARGARGVESAD
ncbi:MAG: DEAD/DEAH box helicase [Agromyces sp.]